MYQAKILIITNLFSPDRGGGAAIISDMCYELKKRGFKVTVRTTYPYYPEWFDKSGFNGWRVRCKNIDGIRVERYGIFIPRKPDLLIHRILHEASFFLSLMRSIIFRNDIFDVIVVYSPLVSTVGYAAILKVINRTPVFLNIQDLSAEAAIVSGISKSKLVNNVLRSVQKFLFNIADLWSTISPTMIERLERIRQRSQPLFYLPNWTNKSLSEYIKKLPDKKGRTAGTPVKLLYAGTVGKKQGLLRLCKSLGQSRSKFVFKINCNGTGVDKIRVWINQVQDKRFVFGPFLEEKDFAQALHDADFYVITEKSGNYGTFLPSKLIPGIASGTPILAVSDSASPIGREVIENRIGAWFSWNNLYSIRKMVNSIPLETSTFLSWQKNAIRRSEFYDRDTIMTTFENALYKLIEKNHGIKKKE